MAEQKPKPPITRDILLRMIALEKRGDRLNDYEMDESIELQHGHMAELLALALVGFDRVVPPVSVAQTERGLEIVVGYPAAAKEREGEPWP